MIKSRIFIAKRPARDPAPEPKPADGAPKPPEGITYTPEQQAHINSLMAADKKKFVTQLETLQAEKSTTEEQRATLEKQIKEIKASYQTKAEQDAEKYQKETGTLRGELENTKKASDSWRTRYSDTVAENAILTAATKNEAFNPELVSRILKPMTELVEVIGEDNQPTGVYETKINMTKVKDGKKIALKLTPEDAVKLMIEQPETYGSLFKSTAKGGLGGNNKPGTNGTVDLAELSKTDPKAFMAAYKKTLPGHKEKTNA